MQKTSNFIFNKSMKRSSRTISGSPVARASVGQSERIMSVSIVTKMTITMLITMMIIVEGNGTYKQDKVPRSLNVSRHFRQLKELRENRGHIEQCRATNLRKEQLGHVNVFAFLDPFWYYSYRQAIMLGFLKKRLEKSNFSNVLYFVVTPPPDLPEDDTENNVKIKAWREISKNIKESQYLSEERLLSDLAKKGKGIIFLQDTSELGIWKNFHASKDEVVIIDRCGKVTYRIIVPWSILYFPYVKAAILSTYKEDPCGPCYEQSSVESDSVDYKEYLLKIINRRNLDTHTERVFTDAKAVSNEESGEIEDDENTSTAALFDVNTSESTINDITTEASAVRTETTENIKNNTNAEDKLLFTDKNIEITSEVPFVQAQIHISITVSNFETTEVSEEAEDCNFSNNEMNRDNIIDSNNDLTRNHEDIKKEKEANENVEHVQKNESIPLRLIMYAPHLHYENGILKKYTHLILKTGSPDYHGHFYSKSTTSDQEITNGDEFNNKHENAEFIDYEYAMADSSGSNNNETFDSESSMLRPSDIDTIDTNTITWMISYKRLIEYYNKLLTGVYYIL